MKEKRNRKIRYILLVVGFMMILLGTTYAFINVRLLGEKKQVIRAGELSLELEEDENNIQLENALPMYDEVGMLQSPFAFKLINHTKEKANYILKLVRVKGTNELNENLVRFSLIKDRNHSKNIMALSDLDGTRGEIVEYTPEIRQEVLKMCHDAFDDRNITTEEECMNALKEASEPYNSFDELITELIESGGLPIARDVLILDTGTIKGKQVIEYEYRMWLDQNIENELLIKGKSLSYRIELEVNHIPAKVCIPIEKGKDTSGASVPILGEEMIPIVYDECEMV